MATHASLLAWRIAMDNRSLAGYIPWGGKESDTTERLSTAQHRQGLLREIFSHNFNFWNEELYIFFNVIFPNSLQKRLYQLVSEQNMCHFFLIEVTLFYNIM